MVDSDDDRGGAGRGDGGLVDGVSFAWLGGMMINYLRLLWVPVQVVRVGMAGLESAALKMWSKRYHRRFDAPKPTPVYEICMDCARLKGDGLHLATGEADCDRSEKCRCGHRPHKGDCGHRTFMINDGFDLVCPCKGAR